MTSKLLALDRIKDRNRQGEYLYYHSIMNKIKKWLDEAQDLYYREEDNLHPSLYYKLWVFFKDDRRHILI